MVDTQKNKMNAVTQMKKVSQMVDDPEWIDNNDKRLDLEAKIRQEQWKSDTAQKTVEDLTPKRNGIAAKMLHEEQQLYKVEKSWGGLGKWLFSKDIQNRIESLANLYEQWLDYDKKIINAKTIIWNVGDFIPYLENERDNLIKKEEAIIKSYHQQAGLEINVDSSVADRRAGVVIQTANNVDNSVTDRRTGTINRPENNIENSVADRRAGVVIPTADNIDNSVTDRKSGTINRPENNIDNSVADRRAGTIIQTENELKKISNIRKQVINNKQSHQQPTNNRRKVGGDRLK